MYAFLVGDEREASATPSLPLLPIKPRPATRTRVQQYQHQSSDWRRQVGGVARNQPPIDRLPVRAHDVTNAARSIWFLVLARLSSTLLNCRNRYRFHIEYCFGYCFVGKLCHRGCQKRQFTESIQKENTMCNLRDVVETAVKT